MFVMIENLQTIEGNEMCGRFVGFRKMKELKQYFPIHKPNGEATANYNAAPTQEALAIARMDEAIVLGKHHWGLISFWSKDTAVTMAHCQKQEKG